MHSSTTLVIASGKGGVGKSVIAVNLAEMLAASGRAVALIDADLGQGACSVLLNEAPEKSLLALARRAAHPEQALVRTSTGITLGVGSFEPGETAGFERSLLKTMDEMLARLRPKNEFIIIDAPAGIEGTVRWAFDRADMGLIPIVGEPTAISDAYRLTKLIWELEPAYRLGAIVNFAETEAEARSVVDRFSTITGHFLNRRPDYCGWVPFSSSIRRSVNRQEPVVREDGPVRNAFARIVHAILEFEPQAHSLDS